MKPLNWPKVEPDTHICRQCHSQFAHHPRHLRKGVNIALGIILAVMSGQWFWVAMIFVIIYIYFQFRQRCPSCSANEIIPLGTQAANKIIYDQGDLKNAKKTTT